MKIAVDVFGGDYAPVDILKGCALAAAEFGHTMVLFGDEAVVRSAARREDIPLTGCEIVHCADAITMEDEPKTILKEHSGCSMAMALKSLAAGQADACVTAGNSGAALMGGTFFVKRIKGISRAAFAPILPTETGTVMLCDSGANVDCRPEMLLQFAQMAYGYMTASLGRPATVGLLNVGTEDCKGGALQQEAFAMLKGSGLPFIGNIEARQIPFGVCDIVVTDGFTGNIALKMMEGTADVIMRGIKDAFMANTRSKIAGMLVKPQLKAFKKKMDTAETGGAVILGLAHPVVKAHGNSKAYAIRSAIKVAAAYKEMSKGRSDNAENDLPGSRDA